MITVDLESFAEETGINMNSDDIRDLVWLIQDRAARLDTCPALNDILAFIRCLIPVEQ